MKISGTSKLKKSKFFNVELFCNRHFPFLPYELRLDLRGRITKQSARNGAIIKKYLNQIVFPFKKLA